MRDPSSKRDSPRQLLEQVEALPQASVIGGQLATALGDQSIPPPAGKPARQRHGDLEPPWRIRSASQLRNPGPRRVDDREWVGEAEIAPGVRVVPTPGHVPGHQSLVVETRRGRVILAGQAFRTASDFAVAQYSRELDRRAEDHGPYPDWLRRLEAFDPRQVLFAHDSAQWRRPEGWI